MKEYFYILLVFIFLSSIIILYSFLNTYETIFLFQINLKTLKILLIIYIGPIAQLVEHSTLNRQVDGASPSGSTIIKLFFLLSFFVSSIFWATFSSASMFFWISHNELKTTILLLKLSQRNLSKVLMI